MRFASSTAICIPEFPPPTTSTFPVEFAMMIYIVMNVFEKYVVKDLLKLRE